MVLRMGVLLRALAGSGRCGGFQVHLVLRMAVLLTAVREPDSVIRAGQIAPRPWPGRTGEPWWRVLPRGDPR